MWRRVPRRLVNARLPQARNARRSLVCDSLFIQQARGYGHNAIWPVSMLSITSQTLRYQRSKEQRHTRRAQPFVQFPFGAAIQPCSEMPRPRPRLSSPARTRRRPSPEPAEIPFNGVTRSREHPALLFAVIPAHCMSWMLRQCCLLGIEGPTGPPKTDDRSELYVLDCRSGRYTLDFPC